MDAQEVQVLDSAVHCAVWHNQPLIRSAGRPFALSGVNEEGKKKKKSFSCFRFYYRLIRGRTAVAGLIDPALRQARQLR